MSDGHPIVISGACKGVKEFKVVRWHKKPGDTVKRGEPLLEIETSKAVLEIESPYSGTLQEISAGDGETVSVRSAVGFITGKSN